MIDTVTYDGLVYVDKYSGAVNLLVWRVLPVGDGCEARDPESSECVKCSIGFVFDKSTNVCRLGI